MLLVMWWIELQIVLTIKLVEYAKQVLKDLGMWFLMPFDYLYLSIEINCNIHKILNIMRIFISFNWNMREILLILFLFSIIYSKTFLIERKEGPEAWNNHGLDFSQPKRQIPLKKFNKECKWQTAASKSKFCQRWIKKW